MLSKKPSVILSSYANLSPLYYTQPSFTRCSTCPPSCRHTFPARQARTYATHLDPPPRSSPVDADLLHWPDPVKPHTTPSPYQILRCNKGEAYSKSRFYALVKLYHPDRCHAGSIVADLPLHVRLERYRLLIAAHDILSHIEKRRAYDTWGAGWGHHRSTNPDWKQSSENWTSDPRHNATWEDWERWRQENEGPRDSDPFQSIQLSNFAFLSLVFAVVSIGGVIQGTRFTNFNNSVIERRDQIHREASMELRRSHNATMSGDRDERIRTFLEHRESSNMGEASYLRLLPPEQTCAPDTLSRP